MEKENRKSLLERYNIPLSHLDFEYVATCTNAREMEKIVNILRSGEEGFFPDLLRCSEEKLKELKPNSKLFRYEEPIKQSDVLGKQELKPIMDWTNDIKTKDTALNELKKYNQSLDLPSVRKLSKIEPDKASTGPSKPESKDKTPGPAQPTKVKDERIRSTDYRKWDKYDPDEEVLRMDLEEERTLEQVEKEFASHQKSLSEEALKEDKKSMYERLQLHLKKLSQLEKEQFAEKHRLRGNEYFKAKEYESAVEEYNCAIIYDPENAAKSYNNRAVSRKYIHIYSCIYGIYIFHYSSDMKLKHYLSAITDCEACLQLEPENIKACLRLADANYAHGRRRESFYMYQRVLELDPENVSAKKSLEKLNSQMGELAPTNATRLMIEELKPDAKEQKPKPDAKEQKPKPDVDGQKPMQDSTKKKKPEKKALTTVPPPKEYDLAELVKPNRMVKSKFVTAAEALGNKMQAPKTSAPKNMKETKTHPLKEPASPVFRLPQDNLNCSNKLLIQEI
ncbi:hypothetical protein KR009_000036 [Drosophila setifemur]|nr:hypothetical protein KR009_000036 [Drosophila setifemur]